MTSNSAFSFKKKMVSLDDDDENVQINIKKNSQDRKIDMDVISNKNVNIGLDLLVNPDKQRKGDTSQPSTPKNDDVSKPVIDFDKDDDDLDFNNLLSKSNKSQENIEQLMSRMNLDDDIPTSSSNDKKETFLDDIKPSTDRDNDVDSHRSLRDDDRNDRRSRSEYNDYDSRPSRSYEDERREKEEVLYQLEKMRRLGVQGIKRFNMSNDLEEMKYELNRIKRERQVESSIKFQRQMLMTFVTGAEYVNDSYNFFNFQLKGWSESVYENINDYDEVFEELHEKYGSKGHVAPELRLLYMVVGSGFMYHLSNSMFKSAPAGIEDILKQNPELMRQFANAAVNQMPTEHRQAASMMNNMAQMGRPRTPHVNDLPPYAPRPVPNNDIRSQSSINVVSSAPKGKSIPAPQGLDEILDDLKSSTTNRDESLSEVISRTERGSRKKTIFQKPSKSSSSTLSL
jgi:hypothetical protein